MSPRRNRPRADRRPDDEPRPLHNVVPVAAPPGWHARNISAERAVKTYVCPGCNNEVFPGTAHVVAWRDGEEDLRRHWHTPCWRRDASRR